VSNSGTTSRNRALFGIALIVISYLLGWPAVGLCAAMAARFGDPMILVIGGPAFYIISWIVLLAGIWLVGEESYRAIRAGGVKGLWRRFFNTGGDGD
jgi:hypothetical protein